MCCIISLYMVFLIIGSVLLSFQMYESTMGAPETKELLGDCGEFLRVWDLDLGKFNITEALVSKVTEKFVETLRKMSEDNSPMGIKQFVESQLSACGTLAHRMGIVITMHNMHLGLSQKIAVTLNILRAMLVVHNTLVETRVRGVIEQANEKERIESLKKEKEALDKEIQELVKENDEKKAILSAMQHVKFNTPGGSSDAVKEDLGRTIAATSSGEQMLAAARSNLEVVQVGIESCKSRTAELLAEKTELLENMGRVQAELESLRMEAMEMDTELDKKRAEVDQKRATVKEKATAVSVLQGRLDYFEGETTWKTKQLEKLEQSTSDMKKEIEKKQDEFDKMKKEKGKLERDAKNLSKKNEKNRRSIKTSKDLVAEAKKAVEEKNEAEKKLKEVQAEKEKLTKALPLMVESTEKIKKKYAEKEVELKNANASLKNAEAALTKTLDQIGSMQKLIDSRSSEWEKLRSQLPRTIEAKDVVATLVPELGGPEMAARLCNSKVLTNAFIRVCNRGVVELPNGKLVPGKVENFKTLFPNAKQLIEVDESYETDSSSSEDEDESEKDEESEEMNVTAASMVATAGSARRSAPPAPRNRANSNSSDESALSDRQGIPEQSIEILDERMERSFSGVSVEDGEIEEAELEDKIPERSSTPASGTPGGTFDFYPSVPRSGTSSRRGRKQAPLRRSAPFTGSRRRGSSPSMVPAGDSRGVKRRSEDEQPGPSSKRHHEDFDYSTLDLSKDFPKTTDVTEEEPFGYALFDVSDEKVRRRSGLKVCCMELPRSEDSVGLSHSFPQDQRGITRQRENYAHDKDPYLMFESPTVYTRGRRYEGLPPAQLEKVADSYPNKNRHHVLFLDYGYCSGLAIAKPERTLFLTRIGETWERTISTLSLQNYRRGVEKIEDDHPITLWHVCLRGIYICFL